MNLTGRSTDISINKLDLLSKIRLDTFRNRLSLEVDGADVANMLVNALMLHKSLNKTTRHQRLPIAPTPRPSPAPRRRSAPMSPHGSVPNPSYRCCLHTSTSRLLHGAVLKPPQTYESESRMQVSRLRSLVVSNRVSCGASQRKQKNAHQ